MFLSHIKDNLSTKLRKNQGERDVLYYIKYNPSSDFTIFITLTFLLTKDTFSFNVTLNTTSAPDSSKKKPT